MIWSEHIPKKKKKKNKNKKNRQVAVMDADTAGLNDLSEITAKAWAW